MIRMFLRTVKVVFVTIRSQTLANIYIYIITVVLYNDVSIILCARRPPVAERERERESERVRVFERAPPTRAIKTAAAYRKRKEKQKKNRNAVVIPPFLGSNLHSSPYGRTVRIWVVS